MKRTDLLPVFLGTDLNCYNCARAFHEAYGVKSHAFGRYGIGSTMYSKIVSYSVVENLDDPTVAVKTLLDYAAMHPGKKKILMGCTDDYVNLIMSHREELSSEYVMPYPDFALAQKITLKSNFYELCEKEGIAYPKTVIVTKDEPSLPLLPFPFPVIVKPASSAAYWKHPFDGMQKVYVAETEEEAKKIIGEIYQSGYEEKIVVQDMIPGTDSNMFVLTAYCGQDGKVKNMCLGHVLLEEHTPKGRGNHAAIVTENNEALYRQFQSFLEGMHYTGFANFDIKFDPRDSSFRAFEINTRQGRSNYYVTSSGQNIAKIVVEDLIDGLKKTGTEYGTNEFFWRYIPDSVIRKYVPETMKNKAFALKKAGKSASLFYRPDLCLNPRRLIYTLVHEYRHVKKFDQYLGKQAK